MMTSSFIVFSVDTNAKIQRALIVSFKNRFESISAGNMSVGIDKCGRFTSCHFFPIKMNYLNKLRTSAQSSIIFNAQKTWCEWIRAVIAKINLVVWWLRRAQNVHYIMRVGILRHRRCQFVFSDAVFWSEEPCPDENVLVFYIVSCEPRRIDRQRFHDRLVPVNGLAALTATFRMASINNNNMTKWVPIDDASMAARFVQLIN